MRSPLCGTLAAVTGFSTRWRGWSPFALCIPLAALLLAGCGGAGSSLPAGGAAGSLDNTGATLAQTAFRIRSDFDADLNANAGWAADLNEDAVITADQPFRLRFEVESAGSQILTRQFALQVRRNQGSWETLAAEDFPYPEKKLRLDFSSPAKARQGWRIVSDASSAISRNMTEAGEFARLSTKRSPMLALGVDRLHWKPVELSARLRLPEHGRVNLVFAHFDADNFYRLDIEAGRGLRMVRVEGGRELTLADREVAVIADDWVELKLERDGSRISASYEWDPVIDGIEFTVELGETLPLVPAGLYLPAQALVDLDYLDLEGSTSTPGVSIVSSPHYTHGSATRDLLPASPRPFVAGAGIDYAPYAPVWSAGGAQGEWEFPVVIRYFFDGPGMHEAGDRFEFRLVDRQGSPVPADTLPTVTLRVPDRHLGGVFVETPGRIGPWEAGNGDLYFLQEPAETDNRMMTVKSDDGGLSWREVDGANRPQTGDLEGVAQVQVGDRIHTLHQTSEHVFYHVFRTSDHPTHPDSWEIVDEKLASPLEPPVQVADLAVRSDGSVVAVYGSREHLLLRTRSTGGVWGEETVVDSAPGLPDSGPVMTLGSRDIIHLAYTRRDGTAWYRQVLPDGTLTRAQQLATGLGTSVEASGGILPLVHEPTRGTVSLIYRLENGELWERRAHSGGNLSEAQQVSARPVVTNAADAEQVGADAVAYADSVHVLFIEEGSKRLFHVSRQGDGFWGEPELLVDDSEVLWVRGNVIKSHAEGAMYGYIYDAGSLGGSGMNTYAEIPLHKMTDPREK